MRARGEKVLDEVLVLGVGRDDPAPAAPLLARIGGGRSLGDISKGAGLDWFAFAQAFGPAVRALTGVNLLRFSKGLKS